MISTEIVGHISLFVLRCLCLLPLTALCHFDDDYEQPHSYLAPVVKGSSYFADAFPSETDFKQRWIISEARKDFTDDSIAKYEGKWLLEQPKDVGLIGDLGLVLKSKAKHHAISVFLERPFIFDIVPLVVQYEVKFQNGMDCGGAYIKLLTHSNNLDLHDFNDMTPFMIMFGPDKCGNDYKVHFIIKHRNPLTGVYEEKHAKRPTADLKEYFNDRKTHLFTLVLNADNSFQVYVDQMMVNRGNLLYDMSPPVNPPKSVVDVNDAQPADWDDREKIPDPNAVKPKDWDDREMIPDVHSLKPEGWLDDEPEFIPDPKAKKPSDWDVDLDGEWEPPKINNPKCDLAPGCGEWISPKMKNPRYKGRWSPPLIRNSKYRGKWSPRMIPNPNYYEDRNPFGMSAIGALGLELWSMSTDILFDNFIVTDNKRVADLWANESWALKHTLELEAIAAQRHVGQILMDSFEERPWLFVVFVIVCTFVALVFIVCCCANPQAEEDAKYKKTDKSPDAALKNLSPGRQETTEYTNVLRRNEDATKTTRRKGKSSIQ